MYFQNFFIFGNVKAIFLKKVKKNCHTDVAESNYIARIFRMKILVTTWMSQKSEKCKKFFPYHGMSGTAMERWRKPATGLRSE